VNTLNSIAHTKGFSLEHSVSIEQAMSSMLKNKNGSVVLLKENIPVGIITEGLILSVLENGADIKKPVNVLVQKTVVSVNQNRPIESAFDLMVTNNIRRLVLVDEEGFYKGLILQEDLFEFLEEDVYKVDLKVSDLLTQDAEIITVKIGTSLQDVLKIMRQTQVGSVIINDQNNAVGIITEKDIISAGYKNIHLSQKVELLMSSPVLSVNTQDAISDVIDLMKHSKVRRVLVIDENNKMHALLTNRDIFKHIKGNVARMLEIKLRHAKEIMNLLPEAIIEIFDADTHQIIHWINKKATEHFGENLLEQSPKVLLGAVWDDLYKILRKNGSVENFSVLINARNFEVSGTLSKNINTRYIKLIAKDITEHETIKQRLQDEVNEETELRQKQEYLMMQQSRLASMGEMIGHIAHQWRQPLAQLGGILMNLESAKAFGELDDAYLHKKITNGNEIIKYMSQTIDDFRLFFTPNESDERFDVVTMLHQAINIVSAGLDYHHIKIQAQLEENTFFAHKYASEFAQVILNLLYNSKDVLAGSTQTQRYIKISLCQKNNENELIFLDNGGGIDPEILEDVFKPYISTKKDQGGTGIGLYMAQLIIEQKMLGTIKVHNEKEGACFVLRFASA